MGSWGLETVPAGCAIFVDSTIFIYHFTGVSTECRDFLGRCEQGDVTGVTSVTVLAEVAHRLLVVEAVKMGIVSGGNPAQKLARRPAALSGLSLYWEQVRQIPLMGMDVLGLDLKVVLDSESFRRQCGLMANDSIIASTASAAGIACMASADQDFQRLPGFDVYGPGDLAG